eukprot:Opistho-1_new@17393
MLTQDGHGQQHGQKRLQHLHLAHAHRAAQGQGAVPGEEAYPHREQRYVDEAAPGRRADRLLRPGQDSKRHGDGQAQHQDPADHLLGRQSRRQARARHIARRGAEHRQQQQAVGPLEAGRTAPPSKAQYQGQSGQGAGPEAQGRPLAQHHSRDRRRGQGQHARDHRGMDGIDMPHRQAQEQRPAEHHAQGGEAQGQRLTPGRPGRARQQQIAQGEQARQRRPAHGHEDRIELGCSGRTAGQPRHRDAQRKDEHPHRAQQQAAGLVRQRCAGTEGKTAHDESSLAPKTNTEPVHFSIQTIDLYRHEHQHKPLVLQPFPGPRRQHAAGPAAGAAQCRTHPAAPAAARRTPALGARMRAPPRRQPLYRGRRLRPVASPGPARGTQAARLLRARNRRQRSSPAQQPRRGLGP